MADAIERTADDAFQGWLDDLEGLRKEVITLHLDRYLWQQLKKAIRAEPPTSGTWLQHYARLYWQNQVIGIRRVCASTARGISLPSLLNEIATHPEVMTRERHLAMYQGGSEFDALRQSAASGFDDMWGDGAGGVDAEKFRRRAAELKGDLKSVFEWADKVVAHVDREGATSSLKFGHVNNAVDKMGEVWKDIALLLTGGGWVTLTPTIQDDWQEPFRRPLFEPLDLSWVEKLEQMERESD